MGSGGKIGRYDRAASKLDLTTNFRMKRDAKIITLTASGSTNDSSSSDEKNVEDTPAATPNLGDQLKSMGIANREQVDSISYHKLGPDGEKLEDGEVIIQISVPKAFQREISIEVFGTSGPECMKAVEPIAELLDLELLSFTPKKEFYENNTDESETVVINKDLKINEGILPSEQIQDENKDYLGESW